MGKNDTKTAAKEPVWQATSVTEHTWPIILFGSTRLRYKVPEIWHGCIKQLTVWCSLLHYVSRPRLHIYAHYECALHGRGKARGVRFLQAICRWSNWRVRWMWEPTHPTKFTLYHCERVRRRMHRLVLAVPQEKVSIRWKLLQMQNVAVLACESIVVPICVFGCIAQFVFTQLTESKRIESMLFCKEIAAISVLIRNIVSVVYLSRLSQGLLAFY